MLLRRASASTALVALLAVFAFVPGVADAHIQMSAPVARKLDDAVKTAPCGPYPKAVAQVDYTAGQAIKVDFRETIDHAGCFQIALSTDNDVTWQLLNQTADPAADVNVARKVGDPESGSPRSITATLPAGVTCNNCTIQIRQVMLEGVAPFNGVCKANQDIAEVPAGKVYFACADVNIVADGAPDGGPTSGSSSSGGTTSSASGGAQAASSGGAPGSADGGASGRTPGAGDPGSSGRNSVDGLDDGGCNAGPGGTGSALALMAVLGLALARRRHAPRRHD